MNRFCQAAALLLSFVVALPQAFAQAPVRIGMTLSLTGPIAAPGAIQKVATETYVEDLNRRGGLLGRKVELILKDDQSRPDMARTLYEQLVTVDKVDLIMGPYGTANILSAMAVAQRYNKILLHNSFGTPRQAKYEMQFSTSGGAFDIEDVWPNLVLNAVGSAPKPPKTIAIVTSKFPSLHFISVGAREVAKKRGLTEVLFLEYEFGNRDFGPIASRLKDAKAGLPDTSVDLLASICYSMWQTLETAANATRSIDDKTLAAWLRKNHVDSIMGRLEWGGPQNYVTGKDIYKIKQLQGGKWQVVWPPEFAAPGAKLLGN